MAKDLYEILGVSKDADEAAIKSAYRNAAIKYHPDRFATASEDERKAAEAKFKEINHAYEVLSDKDKRANYDQYGSEEGPQGFGGFGGGGQGGGFGGFEDILNSFFGGGRGFGRNNPNAPEDGEDIHVRVNLTFEEAYSGVKRTIRLTRDEVCPDCQGSGAKPGSQVKTCPYCKGSGFIRRTQQTIFGQQVVQQVCPHCQGKGKEIVDKCKTCRGTGYVRKDANVTINIPAGVDSGVSLTVRNEGNCGKNGGAKGNLVVAIFVSDSPVFRRVGSDLYMEVPIGYLDAARGCELTIKTMKGDAKCRVPEATQSGTKIRMRGYGMKVLQRDAYGDLYVSIRVETPKGLNSKQLKLLQEFENSLSDSQYPLIKKYKKL